MIYIAFGGLIGFVSLLVGSNFDETFNIFKGIKCKQCMACNYSMVCKCGHKKWPVIFLFILAGGISGFLFNYFSYDNLIVSYSFLLLLLSVSYSDLVERIVSDKLIIIFLPLLIILRFIFPFTSLLDALVGGVVAFSMFYLLAVVGEKVFKQEVIGGGDIKLYAIIGVVLGLNLVLLSIFLASAVGWIFAKIFYNNKDLYLPFVPFIAFGSIMSYLFGYEILTWYFNLF